MISTLLGTIKTDKVFQDNSKGITHRCIVNGNSTGIIHHLNPILDVTISRLRIVHMDCICAHISYSQIGRRKYVTFVVHLHIAIDLPHICARLNPNYAR